MGDVKSTFVWHDMMTTDAERSRAFYTGLLGWKTGEMEIEAMGTYQMIQLGEEPIGGFMPLDPSHGAPSHWLGYIAVASVDACCAKATELGGKVCVPAMDIPTWGASPCWRTHRGDLLPIPVRRILRGAEAPRQ